MKTTRVGERRDLAVEAPGVVAELARERVLRHDAEPDLVRHQHDGPGKPRERRHKRVDLGRDRAPGLEHVRKPERQAIDQHRNAVPRAFEQRRAQGRAAPRSVVQRAPRRARCCAMRRRISSSRGSAVAT